ncbi:Protein of unknown function [Singulisphaera sp. GP187]|uniref:DUF1549 domain-containing protein n=1 Tax=Singulisphaera sp. GP187 TaxID=1882752 RepID=UPI00092CA0D0|nr:DUF1549 domain-containing protein [Singulisphaera sp. GP187]SIO44385.1 Protein of unknown function [Singulisphaera sp. GP187]
MASSRKPGARWCRTIAMVLVVAPSAGLLAMAAAPSNPNAEKASTAVASVKKPELPASKKGHGKAAKAKDAEKGGKKPQRPTKVVSIPTLTSEGLDALMEKHLEAAKVPLAKATTDVEFVRRVHLDLTGKLPTPEQVRGFVLTREKDKRAKLIEYLLRSDDYAENWAHYWRDVIRFRATTQNANQVLFHELETWLAEKFAKNAPWDEIAKGMITATGRDDENGAVIFSLAHETQAVELAGEVSRVFLGVQIQCAQCHDHPNDAWKRQQFHEFAAYFDGLNRKRVVPAGPGQRAVFEVMAKAKPRYAMPDKLDPQKKIFVAPKFFLDPKGEILPAGLTAAERLGIAADYVTGQDNPWFAKAFVNRVWYILLGEGFYNPVDDIGPERTAKAPEVIEVLASEFQKGGYDVRWLLRTILNSRAYQREVRSTYTASGRTSFAAVCPSRLRSDQILDSLAHSLNFEVDPAPKKDAPGKDAKQNALAKDLKEAVGKTKGMRGPGSRRAQFNAIFGADPSTPYEDVLGTIPQALYMMNSPVLNNAMRGNGNSVLGQILTANPKDNRAALGAIYIRVLAREPTLKEVQTCGRYIDKVGNRKEAFEDILWSLINSTEFITRR